MILSAWATCTQKDFPKVTTEGLPVHTTQIFFKFVVRTEALLSLRSPSYDDKSMLICICGRDLDRDLLLHQSCRFVFSVHTCLHCGFGELSEEMSNLRLRGFLAWLLFDF